MRPFRRLLKFISALSSQKLLYSYLTSHLVHHMLYLAKLRISRIIFFIFLGALLKTFSTRLKRINFSVIFSLWLAIFQKTFWTNTQTFTACGQFINKWGMVSSYFRPQKVQCEKFYMVHLNQNALVCITPCVNLYIKPLTSVSMHLLVIAVKASLKSISLYLSTILWVIKWSFNGILYSVLFVSLLISINWCVSMNLSKNPFAKF